MTEYSAIPDPDDPTADEMMDLAERLFSPTTSVDELEHICMRLAHLPTEDAQHLLQRFQHSARAGQVGWLQCAVEEGAFHLMTPRNDLEEEEFLALKVIEDIEEAVVDLSVRRDELDLERRKLLVRRKALAALAGAGRVDASEIDAGDLRLAEVEQEIAGLDARIGTEEAVAEQIRASITTRRYRDADPSVIRSIHLL